MIRKWKDVHINMIVISFWPGRWCMQKIMKICFCNTKTRSIYCRKKVKAQIARYVSLLSFLQMQTVDSVLISQENGYVEGASVSDKFIPTAGN